MSDYRNTYTIEYDGFYLEICGQNGDVPDVVVVNHVRVVSHQIIQSKLDYTMCVLGVVTYSDLSEEFILPHFLTTFDV